MRYGDVLLELSSNMNNAYITVLNDDKYIYGLKVLHASLKKTDPKYRMYVLVPQDLAEEVVRKIQEIDVSVIRSESISIDDADASSNEKQYWNNTFFKLQIMNLVQFDKIVYIDSDMLVLNNLDALFDYPGLSATTGSKSAHPEYTEFNSGIMVIEPNTSEYERLIECIPPAIARKRAEGKGYGDQDVFNEYYKEWNTHSEHNFGEEYNATCSYIDALMKAKSYRELSRLNVIHYVGPDKIWNNSIYRNLRLIIRYIHEGRIYTAKAWWLYMRWMQKVKNARI